MVIGCEEINEEQPGAVARIGPEHSKLVGVPRIVDRTSDTNRTSTSNSASGGVGAGPGKAWRGGCTVLVGRHRRVVKFLEAGKMNAVAAVVADIREPRSAKLTLNVKTPLLGVRSLIVNRHSRLNRKRSGTSDGGGCTDGTR